MIASLDGGLLNEYFASDVGGLVILKALLTSEYDALYASLDGGLLVTVNMDSTR